MPLLQVRNFPQDLYDRLGGVAHREHRTIAQQTVVLLRDALAQPESERDRRARVLQRLANARERGPADLPDPVALIREDRDR